MNIFHEILDCRSLTVIGYKAEDALASATDAEDRRALKAIIETNMLDEAWALAHERLGQHDEARKLRDFMANRQKRLTSLPVPTGTIGWVRKTDQETTFREELHPDLRHVMLDGEPMWKPVVYAGAPDGAVGWVSKTGHGTFFRESLTPELQQLKFGDAPMWKPVVYGEVQF